jgi:hypothetical protein
MKSLPTALIILFILSAQFPLSAQVLFNNVKGKKIKHKDDIVIMENGDRITGEIKKMEFGILYLKSDRAVDTLKLDWKRIIAIRSKGRYEFEMRTGHRYVGVIIAEGETLTPRKKFKIQLDVGPPLELNIEDILGVREMQRSFLGRLNLELDAGLSFTQGNKQTQTTFHTSIEYLKPKYSFEVDANSIFSGVSGDTDTSRHEILFGANRVITLKWKTFLLTDLLHDNQQQLDLRTTIAGGLTRVFVKTNRTLFTASGGIAYTKENYFPEAQSDRNNAEALAGLTFATYHFRGSEINMTTFVFPSLSDPGRVRIDSYVYWKLEITSDLYWKVSLINNYDSRPPSDAINNNLSATASVGWSF